ncbi:LuxR family transcriptional regulator [Mucilaginibacter limnophilus]|uniref:LuxR family transcriptional regulator n=1 Tax=Mucilaginibacter limnophilus TaxID=1932778 RepID=A0A3S2V231_9SPHI|nr:LuxR C-terminal-related transcriptional regulator [Mucilaginibacter limnophilus]RVU01212.1 LuxR family transcriptional regulator [Mucilaginibacter limnophilus]
MQPKTNLLHEVWDKNIDLLARTEVELPTINIEELLASFFCPGPFYYYVVDFYDRRIIHMSPKIKDVLGLEPQTVTFDDILNRIMPEDMNYVANAETTVYDFTQKKGWDKVTNYKTGYCFRMKSANGNFQMFHHQALVLSTDTTGGIGKTLNIHTNVEHLTTVNSHKATLTGIGNSTDFFVFDVPLHSQLSNTSLFTKREREIICLMAAGFNSTAIAERLFLSLHTVKQHRKNILGKAGASNSSELIALCLKAGLI